MLRLQTILLLVALPLITNNTKAQNDSARNHLMIVPSYATFNALKIDYEVNIKNNHWIQLSPQYYFGKAEFFGNDHSDYKFLNLTGFGLDINHKVYICPGKWLKPGTYLSYGVAASYLTLQYINKQDVMQQTQTKSFYKIGGDLIIGFDFAIPRFPMIFGPYAGLGYRFSFTEDADIKNHFTKNYFDFAYSGNLFVFGFKMGVRF